MLTRTLLAWALAGVAVRVLGVCGLLLDDRTPNHGDENDADHA